MALANTSLKLPAAGFNCVRTVLGAPCGNLARGRSLAAVR